MSLGMNKVSEAIWMASGLNKKIAASLQNNSRYSVPSRNDMIFANLIKFQRYVSMNIV